SSAVSPFIRRAVRKAEISVSVISSLKQLLVAFFISSIVKFSWFNNFSRYVFISNSPFKPLNSHLSLLMILLYEEFPYTLFPDLSLQQFRHLFVSMPCYF